jgi:citrate lyase subunit beta/citryl-CoA lyase
LSVRRSLLYMPGANERALEKAKGLDCDTLIFDLEDAVAPQAKAQARAQVVTAVRAGGYGYRELVVRCNGLDSPWGQDDLRALADTPISALLFPKIETAQQVHKIAAELAMVSQDLAIWIMIETPRAILDLEQLASLASVQALVMGTSDLVTELRASHVPGHENLQYALQRSLLVARLYGKEIFDGVQLNFTDAAAFRSECEQGRAMGFDGKTLIHPSQIGPANAAFGETEAQVERARGLLAAWDQALTSGKGVAVYEGQLVENLHAAEARRIIARSEALAARPR